jgi:hypothetical protein
MKFTPHTQEELHAFSVEKGKTYLVQYVNKDYYNGDETIEEGKATAMFNGKNIYFTVTDPYGMDKMIMQARILKKIK